MPWSWECRAKMIKQVPAKPTRPRGQVIGEVQGPGPMQYDTPEIICGNGYSHIKRSPAYTFGHRTPINLTKPVLKSTAPILDTWGMGAKGPHKIKLGVVSPKIETPGERTITPGPAAYVPRASIQFKRQPAFSMRPPARPPYQPWDQWTPSPNMYLPDQPGKKCPPAYTFGNAVPALRARTTITSPGDYSPNFNYVQRTKPAFSFGAPYKSLREPQKPAPNTYCEKKFMYTKPSVPAPSFGIRHSLYIGRAHEYLKPPELSVVISGEN
ncbi:ciliary microtubule associated protein 1A-like [Maniola hyperantus]|uniref:ciliary microtubule associated protein 1A-like n=1 Tax=Aphantopus hyperantus TaxID=2795564 RepID=UPI0015688D89|nr:outer dense fiber protein 3-like [Maniola hyperantus]